MNINKFLGLSRLNLVRTEVHYFSSDLPQGSAMAPKPDCSPASVNEGPVAKERVNQVKLLVKPINIHVSGCGYTDLNWCLMTLQC